MQCPHPCEPCGRIIAPHETEKIHATAAMPRNAIDGTRWPVRLGVISTTLFYSHETKVCEAQNPGVRLAPPTGRIAPGSLSFYFASLSSADYSISYRLFHQPQLVASRLSDIRGVKGSGASLSAPIIPARRFPTDGGISATSRYVKEGRGHSAAFSQADCFLRCYDLPERSGFGKGDNEADGALWNVRAARTRLASGIKSG